MQLTIRHLISHRWMNILIGLSLAQAVSAAYVAEEYTLAVEPTAHIEQVKTRPIGKIKGSVHVQYITPTTAASSAGAPLWVHASSVARQLGIQGLSKQVLSARAVAARVSSASQSIGYLSADAYLQTAQTKRRAAVTSTQEPVKSYQDVVLDGTNTVKSTKAPLTDGVGVLLLFLLAYVIHLRKRKNIVCRTV